MKNRCRQAALFVPANAVMRRLEVGRKHAVFIHNGANLA
jgi:hypothetical protein